MLDAIVENFPSIINWLKFITQIVHRASFENTVVKLQRGSIWPGFDF